MPEALYYKVVSTTGTPGVYEPAIMAIMDDKRVTYEIGKTTTPPKEWGPLAAFCSQHTAFAFMRAAQRGNHIVLRGTGTESPHDFLWFKDKYCTERVTRHDVPEGTVFLASFTPTDHVR